MKFLVSLWYEARKRMYVEVFCKLLKGNGLSRHQLGNIWGNSLGLPPIRNLVTDYINQIMIKQPELFGRKMQYVNTKVYLIDKSRFPSTWNEQSFLHISVKYILSFKNQHKCYLPCEIVPDSSRQNELLLFLGVYSSTQTLFVIIFHLPCILEQIIAISFTRM